MFSREIRAEQVPFKFKAFWKRQPPVDNGELQRTRLGLDERRAQSRLRPHSEQLGEISIKRGRDAETSDPLSTTGG